MNDHTLVANGAPHTAEGRPLAAQLGGTAGTGHAMCSCGTLSALPLPDAAFRRQWHRQHVRDQNRPATPTVAAQPAQRPQDEPQPARRAPRPGTVRLPAHRHTETIPAGTYTTGQLEQLVDAAIADLNNLRPRIAELVARDAEQAAFDGYPAGGSDSTRTSDHADPTARTVEQHAGARHDGPDQWRNLSDPVHDHVIAAMSTVIAAKKLTARAVHRVALLDDTSEKGRTRQVVGGDCQACGRYVANSETDRLRAGYCNACRMAWARYQQADPHADRARFERERRAQLEAA